VLEACGNDFMANPLRIDASHFPVFHILKNSRSGFWMGTFGLALIALTIASGALGASLQAAETALPSVTTPLARSYIDLDLDWRFAKGDRVDAMIPAFEDSAWSHVNVPHDWSSEGPFSADNGSGNGYAPGGVGWYRKHFKLDAADANKLVAVEFDGVYDYAEVWLNGQFVGGRPYGYSSFECELTPRLRVGLADNVLAVRVDHSRFADSRWYTGSGIYRHVRLRVTDRLRISHWGTYVTTPDVSSNSATVQIETRIENSSRRNQPFSLQVDLIGPDGVGVASMATSGNLSDATNLTVVQQLKVAAPQLWSPDSPVLYTLKSRLSAANAVVDDTETHLGIRTLRFDPNKGFFLNGTSMKLKGVCIHHEAGCLGAAVPDSVLERRLRILKELGVNAIRTSHNPPAPELLDLCDRLGFLVKDEAFDEFTPAKNKWVTGRNNGEPSHFGYAELFEQWSVTDVSDMVRRDRNHPCVILWSIGNEIDYPNDPFSHPVLGNEYRPGNPPAQELVTCARPLIAAIRKLDPTRPVTAALASVAMSDAVGLGELLDAVGYNYQETRYAADHRKYPTRFIFGSENSSGYSQWLAVRDNDYVGGQFLWTGIDYLGEANQWPNRGSSAGLLDLCGFKKPNAWFRQSLWSEKPMVYLCVSGSGGRGGRGRGGGFGGAGNVQESWNWPSNATVSVRCYTTCPDVELTLNDKPLGTRSRSESNDGSLTWQVPFEPGTLKAVGRKNGNAVCDFVLKTAGPARQLALLPNTTELRADGKDVCQIEFQVVDTQGVRVPGAVQEVTFAVDGPAKLIGIENGNLNDPSNGKGPSRQAMRGRGLAYIQSTPTGGRIRVTASSPGLEPITATVSSR
jgi:beta-galactosidase